MGGAMRQMGRDMPPPAEAVMDIEDIAEATRWIMKSNWGPDQNTSAAVATGIILGVRARDVSGKGQPVSVTMLNANAWTNADEEYEYANRPPISIPDAEIDGREATYPRSSCGGRARDLSGKGQPVSVTMLNANAWTNADEYYDYANRPPISIPDAEIHGLNALYRLYRCREGWVFLGCLFQDEWETFCRTVERPDLLADRRFTTREARHDNDEALIAELANIFAGRDAAEWEDLLLKADIGCVRADEALEGEFYADHPHAKANALSVEVDHPTVGKHLRYGGLVEFSLTPGRYKASAQVGQHTKPLLDRK